MSGPHQPGWSDEELISLTDLHLSRKTLGIQPTDAHASQKQGQGKRPSPVRATQQEAPPKTRVAGDPARKASPRAEHSAASQSIPAKSRRSTPVEAKVPSRSSNTASTHHAVAPVASAHSNEKSEVRHELGLRKLLPLKDKHAVKEKLLEQVRFPLRDAKIGVFSRKGGVGKTTITAYLALTLATLRHRPVVAVDGDSEAGSLGWLLAPNAPSALDALAQCDPMPVSREEFRPFVAHTKSGVDVVLGDTGECPPVNEKGLRHAVNNLSKAYDMSLYDTGSGVTHRAGRALINSSRVLLLVMGTSVDSVRAAERTLAWLDEREDATQPPTTVIAVINGIPSQMRPSQIEQIETLFADRCAAVVRIPFDEHLAGGTTHADLASLAKSTQHAFRNLAATTVEVLARSTPLQVNRERQHA